MIFFFGTRASKIKERKIRRTTCSYCNSQDSFIIATFSKYFHFFWIPILPFSKTHIAECTHCKKTYAQNEFTHEMHAAIQKENETNPAKRPIWQGIGCIILILLFFIPFLISLFGAFFGNTSNDNNTTIKDVRYEYLKEDINSLSADLHPIQDSISFALKTCVDYDIESGIDTDQIKYFSKINEDKLLVLLEIRDMKKIKATERKVMIDVVEDCLTAMSNLEHINDYYIGVEGKWNTILVKTPTDEDLGGKFADKNKLLPFYGAKELETDLKSSNETFETTSDSINLD